MATAQGTRVPDEAADYWRVLTQRIAQEPDDDIRRGLETVARHVETEYLGDIPTLMGTFAPAPSHWYLGALNGSALEGAAAVQASYEREIDEGRRHLFRFSRVVADRSSVVLEGTMHVTAPGSRLLANGTADVADIDPTEWYVLEYGALVVLPISADGLIEGERVYFAERPRVKGILGPAERTYLGPNEAARR